uniref:VQ domain-containing protein n=1 Tax=Noccaea caerulescens TaxID=107243 RepID=A0A1J3IMJ1_NOCCA
MRRASMENSPRYRGDVNNLLPSPGSCIISSTLTRPVTTGSESTNHPVPTTFVQTDASSFKQVVQLLTGSYNYHYPTHKPDPRSSYHSIPPIKAVSNKKQSFRLNERRNSMKHLKINPVHSGLPEKLSPSILDFPSLLLTSPDTPLFPDPFYVTGSSNRSPKDSVSVYYDPNSDEEARAIKEKGFYLHRSPSTTPRDPEPRLLPLFPVTSPRLSESVDASI